MSIASKLYTYIVRNKKTNKEAHKAKVTTSQVIKQSGN